MYHYYIVQIIIYGIVQFISISSTDGLEVQNYTQADGFLFDGPAERSPTNINENLNKFQLSAISTSAPGTNFGRRKISHISTFQHCLKSCQSDQDERKPVCGSDGLTYDNAKQVHCARMCGKLVQIKPCNNEVTTIETTIQSSLLDSNCIKNCSSKTSDNYNPVCGDGVTYDNSEIVSCIQNCGKSIKVVSPGICTYSV
ncbi:serine protease inhibitor dipetalogastin-like [Leptopilina heterotoma]|uniref:serine protease inhibitor dipetalogastin-like n=1 Tax=Leptopilina heterotoma TaxID=63436 RepID=UPI001CA85A99|nr:serine protease inhibitor dipetalogastin-like [Leptopilina heterotoma]XP_043464866.1 serine protease inhibitor dipetalogastin-like [Leptopilina heterotoma]